METRDNGVYVTVSDEKWEKSQRYIGEMLTELWTSQDGRLDFKPLESKRGYLIYVTRTYPSTVPYLKGIHLTLDSWRANRDEDGWNIPLKARLGLVTDPLSDGQRAPKRVKAVPRLKAELEALQELFKSDRPPRRKVRSSCVVEVFYGFGDASGVGACLNMQKVDRLLTIDEKTYYCYGHWCDSVSEESSNYQELLSLVETLELQVRDERLANAEVFIFTDNSTAEAVFYKGNSTSKKLFELVLRLRHMEMEGQLILHVIHVAGTRMIEEGADGGSRGDLTQGAMARRPILDYVPLHLSALNRCPQLKGWVRSWWNPDLGDLKTLTAEGWYDEAQNDGCFLWTPPPAAADVAGELLGEAKHKCPMCTHILLIPRLMTGRCIRESHYVGYNAPCRNTYRIM
jgi:hypothetical protein